MSKHTYTTGFTTDFEHISADSPETQKFTLIYTHGFCSDPWGRKPEEIKKWCQKNNISFYRYELAGHGSDNANIENADINVWKSQILEIIDTLTTGPIVVAGASLGGWLSLLAAVHRPTRIVGVLGLAAAPDFTKEDEDNATEEQKATMAKYGKLVFEESGFRFVITQKLLDSGRQNLLLDKSEIAIDCPVVLVQGMEDKSVYWQKAIKIAQKIRSRNVVLKIIKNADHRLNADNDISQILSGLDYLLSNAK